MSQAEPGVIQRARWFAALSGPFDPVALLDALGDVGDAEAMDVTVDLASACDTSEPAGWLMRGSVRRREITALAEAGRLDAALRWRREHARDAATADLLDALSGAGPYTRAGISEALAGRLEREPLTRMAVALERAGTQAPAHKTLDAVRAALGRVDAVDRAHVMLDRGFYGRETEITRAENWLNHPHTRRPVTALYVNGLPGIGKSTLIDEVIDHASGQSPPWIIVRLDFDRGGLDVRDLVGLTMEISRLVSRELGPASVSLRPARLHAAGAGSTTGPNVKGAGRDRIPDDLSLALGQAVRASGRPVLLMLDTMEVLRGRGQTHPLRLFETLDELCERGLQPLAVIAAGRGQALDGVPERIGERIELAELDDLSADQLLDQFHLAPAVTPRIREVSAGIPLVLRLGARLVSGSGAHALDRVAGRRELASAYLYRFLLSRIDDEKLRALAQPGLIVRRINPDLIEEVLAPQAGMKRMPPTDALAAFESLDSQRWLVEPDSVAGWLRHRSDVRKTLLRNLYDAERPATTSRLNRAAARWFEGRTEPFAPLEAAYHHLQAMRSGGQPPRLSPSILSQLDEETLAELPDVAQDVVRIARGDSPSRVRNDAAPTRPIHDGAIRRLEATLERSDLREAEYIYDRSFDQSALDPASEAADVARSFLWRAGRWAVALRGFDPHRYFSGRFGDRSPVVTLAQFEMWAESHFAQLTSALIARSELAELAADLGGRGLPGSLGNGALGFALARAGARPSRGFGIDPIETATALWAPTMSMRGAPGPAILDALAMPADSLASLVSGYARTGGEEPPTPRLPDISTPAGAARVLATTTPYRSVIEASLALSRGTALRDQLTHTERELAHAGGLPPSGAGDWHIVPAASAETAIDNLTALGLLAECVAASAFALRQADLSMIARSAEQWRRTCAGSWAFSAPAPDPSWSLRPDVSIADRVAALGSEEECLDQLRIWSAAKTHTEARHVFRRLRRRYPAADRATTDTTAEDAAATLLEHRVPSAFVPAMAVLSSLERKRSS